MTIVAIIAVVLLAGAVAIAVATLREPRLRRAEYLEQIEAYGYSARTPAPEPKPRPADASTGAIATPPRTDAPPRAAAVTPAPQPQQPVQQAVAQPQAPMQITPQAAPVEIKSMPVAGVDNSAQPATQAAAEALTRRFGRGAIEGRISAHVVVAVR